MIHALILGAITALPQQFASLPLASALRQAVSLSPDVAQARERVAENLALLNAARGSAFPQATVNYAQAPQGGNNGGTIEQRLVTLGGQVTLGDYFAFSPLVREAQATLSAAQFDLLDAQRTERIKTVGEYFDTLKATATLALRESDERGAQSDLRAASLRFRAGQAPRLDVVRAEVALARAQADLDAARVSLSNAEHALALETGEPLQSFARVSARTLPAPPAADPDKAVQRALAQRSDIGSALQAVTQEDAAVRVSERSVLPSVTLSAGYTTGMDSGVHVQGPSANIQVGFPLSHAARSRTKAERARLAQAQFRVESIRRQIVIGVGAAARTYQESVLATRSATRARVAAQAELHATQIGYRSGASSSLDVADARRTYIQAAIDELSAIYAQAQAAASLEQELGP